MGIVNSKKREEREKARRSKPGSFESLLNKLVSGYQDRLDKLRRENHKLKEEVKQLSRTYANGNENKQTGLSFE